MVVSNQFNPNSPGAVPGFLESGFICIKVCVCVCGGWGSLCYFYLFLSEKSHENEII